MSFQGHPKISILYYDGEIANFAHKVMVEFVPKEGAETQTDPHEDEMFQSALAKMIECSEAKAVVQANIFHVRFQL